MAAAEVGKLRKVTSTLYQAPIKRRFDTGDRDKMYANFKRLPNRKWKAEIRYSRGGDLIRDCGDFFRTRREAIDEVEIMAR